MLEDPGAALPRRSSARALALALGIGGLLVVSATSGGAANAATRVSLRATRLGRVLVSAQGHTLYVFSKDPHGKSACSTSCAKTWRPLVLLGKPAAGGGAETALLGETKRSDGRLQVTYAGHPLYSYAVDASPGQTKGEALSAFGGTWYAISASGAPVHPVVTAATTTAPPPTTTTTPVSTTTPLSTTTTPPVSAPASSTAEAGLYCGFTNNNSSICFTVTAGGADWTTAHFGITNASCEPGPTHFDVTYDTTGQAAIGANLAFNFAPTTGDSAGTVVSGTLTTTGQAQGHMHVDDLFVYNGVQYTCVYDDDWSAKIQN